MSFNKIYKEVKNVFGSEPEEILVKYFDMLNKSKPVLDIGCGQGRNSIFLAGKGYNVDAVDTSIVAVEELKKIAIAKELKIQTYRSGFQSFLPCTNYYSGILVFGLIQILSENDFAKLKQKLEAWTGRDSLIFITAFGTADPSFEKYSTSWDAASKNNFTDDKGNYRRFLEPGEILSLFNEYEVIHHREGFGKEHHHGDGKLEKHYMVEVVLKK
ncbi:MAG: class I SAM-dependent methyltransferase [Ignavibacteria bacterium]|jgi:SAM-dependent methyltransferase